MPALAVSGEPLSIVLPVRNGGNFLAEALESVLAQDGGQFVLHVSDNASDDATPEILADFAARDARIEISRSEAPLSQVANMNRAVSLARTPWVRMLCHDDLLRPDCVRQTLAAIAAVADTRVALIGNGERHLFTDGYLTPVRADAPLAILSGGEVLRRRFHGTGDQLPFPAVTTATFRTDALTGLGGFDPRWVHFDTFAWYRLLTRWDYAFLPAPLTVNRIHPAQVAAKAQASLRTVEDHRLFMAEFHAEHGEEFGLPRWRMALIAPGLAGRAVLAELRAGHWRRGLAIPPRLPLLWWPLLPALTLRAWLQDRKRLP